MNCKHEVAGYSNLRTALTGKRSRSSSHSSLKEVLIIPSLLDLGLLLLLLGI